MTSRRADDGYDVVVEVEDERNGVYMNVNMEFGFGDFFGLMKVCDLHHVLCFYERMFYRRRILR